MDSLKKKDTDTRLLIGITLGDPCGIGPEIVLKSLKSPKLRNSAKYLIIGNREVFDYTIEKLKMPVKYKPVSLVQEIEEGKDSVHLISFGDVKRSLLKMKKPNAQGGALSAQWILEGINLALKGSIDALVTAPISKEAIHLGGYDYPGHTEMLQKKSGSKRVVMLMIGGKLRVAFATTHIALRDVCHVIREKDILETIRICHDSLVKYFGFQKPRIAVCGVNPHAGESGIFGDEEKKVIIPAVKKAQKKGISCNGPVSADTVFYKAVQGLYDLVIAIYHDQGATPLKLHAFETGVNITLGLPFIRTSPDHGTAYDIAGKGIANPLSMKEAIKTAVKMAAIRLQYSLHSKL